MVTSMRHFRLGWCCTVLLACVAGVSSFSRAAEKEKTLAEWMAIVRSPAKASSERVPAIRKVGEVTSPEEERDNKISDGLMDVLKSAGDLFVRKACVESLAKLQKNCNSKLKDHFRKSFVDIFTAKEKERLVLRSSVAEAFREVLDNQSLPDKDVYTAVVAVAKSPREPEGFRGTCITIIGKFGADDGIEILAGLLSDPSQLIREKAAGAIYDWLATSTTESKIPLPAITKLVEMLTDKTMQADLKVNVMKALAQMMREGNTAALKALPSIKEIVEKTEDQKLLLGGIMSLGIIGSADAVEPLKKAYKDYFPEKPAAKADDKDKEKTPADGGKDVEVRKAVMDALVTVLATQADKAERAKAFEPKAVHETAVLLIKALDDDPSATVKNASVFAMQYLYPPKFVAEQKEALDALITLMRTLKPDDDLKPKIVDALKAISDMDFGDDIGRWDSWFHGKFGGKVTNVEKKDK